MNRRKAYQSDFYVVFSNLPSLPQTIVVEPKPSRFRAVLPEGWGVAQNGDEFFCSHHVFHMILGGVPKVVYLVVRSADVLTFDEENSVISLVNAYIINTF